jgi:4-amino-4-deoxy-L-arabinose transferase-like glycosyltransferase
MTYNYRPLACDMAEYLNNPLRILFGDIPYSDFWLLFPPGEVYFPALVYKIFGANTDYARIVTILTSCFVPVAGFYLGLRLFGENTEAIIAAFIFYFFSVVTNYEGPDYISLYLLFILLGAVNLVKYFRANDKNSNLLVLSGLMMAFAFFFKLYEVGGVYVAFLLMIFIYEKSQKSLQKQILKSLTTFVVPGLILFVILLFAFGSHSSKMLNELIFESVKNGTSMNLPYFNDLYYITISLTEDFHSLGTLGNIPAVINLFYHSLRFIVALGYYLIPFLSIIIFIFYFLSKLDKPEYIIALLIFLWALVSFPKALGRSDLAHLAPSVAPFILFMFFVAVKSKRTVLKKTSLIIVIIMFFSVLFPFFKVLSLAKTPRQYVKTANGCVPFKKAQDKIDFENTYNFIIRHTDKSDYIFVTPWDAPPVYALTGRRNPAYYDSLNDLIIRKDKNKQKKIISDIIKHKTKLIIHSGDWGYDNKPEQQFTVACSLLQQFINERCYPLAKFGFYTIYEIKDMKE